jgi:hypothetical protein
MEILIALGIAIAIAARKFIRDSQGQTNDAWSAAAAHLDLDFTRGALFRPRKLQGQLHGNSVEVSTVTRHTGKVRKVRTRYRVHYPRPLRLGLSVTESTMLSGVSVFLGAQDIDTGDAIFDRRFIVKGNNLYRVADFLNASRRREITDLFDELGGVRLDDDRIEWSSKSIASESSELIDTLMRLSWAATKIYEGDQDQMPKGPEPMAEPLQGDSATAAAEPGDAPAEQQVEVVAEGSDDIVPTDTPAEAGEVAGTDTSASTVHPPPVVSDSPANVAAGPDADSVCNDLFRPSVMSFEARKRFDERYKDQRVRWTGKLRRVASYRIDLTFAGGPGTKATFDLNLNGSGTAGRTIQAIVQLPPEADTGLRSHVGEPVTFEGTLAACDALVRNFHIADGQIV